MVINVDACLGRLRRLLKSGRLDPGGREEVEATIAELELLRQQLTQSRVSRDAVRVVVSAVTRIAIWLALHELSAGNDD